MVFRSKVDSWLIWVVRLPLLAAVLMAVYAAFREATGATVTIAALVVILFAVVEWIFASTYYTVDQDFVRIRSGPFRSRVLISDIQTISRTSDAAAAPALSLDRVKIRDVRGRSFVVSPNDRDLFIETLRSVNSKIQVT